MIATSQDERALSADDLVDGKTNPWFTKKVDTAHEKEIKESLQSNDNNDESSSESDVDEVTIKVETTELEPLTSQDTSKSDRNFLFDKIGEILEIKTKLMTPEIKLDIANNAKDLKSDMNNLKSDIVNNAEELKSDMTTLFWWDMLNGLQKSYWVMYF